MCACVCVCVCVCVTAQSGHLHISCSSSLPRALLLSSVCDEHPQDLSALHPLIGACVCVCVCVCVEKKKGQRKKDEEGTSCTSPVLRKQVSGVGWTVCACACVYVCFGFLGFFFPR